MDAIPAMILFVPVLMPVATAFGITPVQLGLIIVITLAVGQVTPPYGLCLLIAGRISGMSVQKSFKAVIPVYHGFCSSSSADAFFTGYRLCITETY